VRRTRKLESRRRVLARPPVAGCGCCRFEPYRRVLLPEPFCFAGDVVFATVNDSNRLLSGKCVQLASLRMNSVWICDRLGRYSERLRPCVRCSNRNACPLRRVAACLQRTPRCCRGRSVRAVQALHVLDQWRISISGGSGVLVEIANYADHRHPAPLRLSGTRAPVLRAAKRD